ncbi:MAG: hypothetical protein LIP08_15495 [Bacteroides sp.]|nr:hypothetical protein [Bacteroides sp.]
MKHIYIHLAAKWMIFIFVLSFLWQSCQDTELISITEEEDTEVFTRGSFNQGYFDWDRISHIEALDQERKTHHLTLPWSEGSTQMLGIPDHWIDKNAEAADTKQRLYARENGWVLVYSNMQESQNNKYFALYNKYTGILRFFYYALGTKTDKTDSNSTFIGINLDKPSSLFNFTTDIPTPINDRKAAAFYSFSPNIALSNGVLSSLGYAANQWYGMEIECAYDPHLQSDTRFSSMIWAARLTPTTGNIETSGTIKGEIRSAAPNKPNLTLNFGDNSSTSEKHNYYLDQESTSNTLGDKIDSEIKKGNSFFSGLWTDVKSNASKWIPSGLEAGAKQGIKAIMSSEGSVVASTLGGVLNSLIGGPKENIMKVDLSLEATSVVELNTYTATNQWKISPFPVPGARNTNAPLYNTPLGVWNLETPPMIEIDTYIYWTTTLTTTYSNNTYRLLPVNVILNPAVAAECEIKNLSYHMLLPQRFTNQTFLPKELVSMQPYYNIGKRFTTENQVGSDAGLFMPYNGYVRVKFDLVNKSTGATVATFSKCFFPQSKEGNRTEERELWNGGPGRNGVGPGGGGIGIQ